MSIEEKIKTAKEDSWLKDSVSEKEFKEIKDNERRMTNEEEIELLCAYGVPLDEEKFCEALDMAIKALGAEQKDGDLISRFRDYQIEWLTSHNDIDLRETETWVVQFLKDTAECFLKTELPSVKTDTDLISRETLLKELSVVQNRPVRQTDVDLIRRTDLLNKIWQKEYGKDYDGVNMLDIPHIDIIENMPSYNSIKTELNGDLIHRKDVITMLNKIENAVEDGDGFQFNEWIDYAKHIQAENIDGDLISRQAVNKLRKYNLVGGVHTVSLDDINKLPSAEKTAEWIIYGKQGGIPISYRCSNCDFGWENNKFKYCPHCGARMKGVE